MIIITIIIKKKKKPNTKNERINLTKREKKKILKYLEKGHKIKTTARKFDVPRKVIIALRKQKDLPEEPKKTQKPKIRRKKKKEIKIKKRIRKQKENSQEKPNEKTKKKPEEKPEEKPQEKPQENPQEKPKEEPKEEPKLRPKPKLLKSGNYVVSILKELRSILGEIHEEDI